MRFVQQNNSIQKWFHPTSKPHQSKKFTKRDNDQELFVQQSMKQQSLGNHNKKKIEKHWKVVNKISYD